MTGIKRGDQYPLVYCFGDGHYGRGSRRTLQQPPTEGANRTFGKLMKVNHGKESQAKRPAPRRKISR